MDAVGATPGARPLSHQFAPVLEKIHMPPASLDCVVHSAEGSTLGTLKLLPWNVIESQFQAFGFSLKTAFAHSPLLAQSKRYGKKFFLCHGLYSSPPSPKTQIAVLASEQSLNIFCA